MPSASGCSAASRIASTLTLSTMPNAEAISCVKRLASAESRQPVVCAALHVGGRGVVGMVMLVPVVDVRHRRGQRSGQLVGPQEIPVLPAPGAAEEQRVLVERQRGVVHQLVGVRVGDLRPRLLDADVDRFVDDADVERDVGAGDLRERITRVNARNPRTYEKRFP